MHINYSKQTHTYAYIYSNTYMFCTKYIENIVNIKKILDKRKNFINMYLQQVVDIY